MEFTPETWAAWRDREVARGKTPEEALRMQRLFETPRKDRKKAEAKASRARSALRRKARPASPYEELFAQLARFLPDAPGG